jgi:hypothetical protein
LGKKTFAEVILNDHEALRNPCGFAQKPFLIVIVVEHIGQNDRIESLISEGHFCALIFGNRDQFTTPADALDSLDTEARNLFHQRGSQMAETTADIQNAIA